VSFESMNACAILPAMPVCVADSSVGVFINTGVCAFAATIYRAGDLGASGHCHRQARVLPTERIMTRFGPAFMEFDRRYFELIPKSSPSTAP
jgi:hypothetical protein